jgi:hypothetical protein
VTTATKRRILNAALAIFATWPLAQIYLALSHHVDPWKLCGWGMYATPRMLVSARLGVERAGSISPYDFRQAPAAVQAAFADYVNATAVLGDLASTAAVEAALFAHDPAADRLIISVERTRLDRRTATMAMDTETRTAARPASRP